MHVLSFHEEESSLPPEDKSYLRFQSGENPGPGSKPWRPRQGKERASCKAAPMTEEPGVLQSVGLQSWTRLSN